MNNRIIKRAFILLGFLLFGHVNFSQDIDVSPGSLCGNDYAYFDKEIGFTWADYFGTHYQEDGNGNTPTLRARWNVNYPIAGGTFTIGAGDPENTLLELWEVVGIWVNYFPSNWFNPAILEVELELLVQNGVNWDVVNTLDAQITPRMQFQKTGWTCTIDGEDDYTYTVSDISGVSYNWTYPSGWTPVGATNSNQITLTAGPSASPGNIQVTTTPSLDACGYPAICNIEITDCFEFGQTDYTFCGSPTWTTELNTQSFGDKMKFPRFIADFSGDGKDDIIGFGNHNIRVGESNGSAFNMSTWSSYLTYGNGGWRQDDYPRKIGDFNGDGKADIVGFGATATFVATSTGSAFNTITQWHSGFDYDAGYTDRNVVSREIGDFNGDGKDDVFGIGYTSTAMGLSNGSQFVSTPWSGALSFTATTGGMSDRNKWPIMVGNFDGDPEGKDDLVGFGNNNVIVAISTGTGFVKTTWAYNTMSYGDQGFQESKYPRMVGDFNGDGRDDIIGFGDMGVSVGISTGSSFVVSNWLNGEEFTRKGVDGISGTADDWIVDNREIGVVSIADFIGEHEIRIADMNADGMDDIVGFNELGTFVAYSTGSHFMCPTSMSSYSNAQGNNSLQYIRSVGNFDITDEEPEIIGFGYHNVIVMNCDNCPNPNAEINLVDPLYTTTETGYQGNPVEIDHYCLGSEIIADLDGTECEDRYYYAIYEFDISTWNSNLVYDNGWVLGKAPDQLDVTNDVSWITGQVYMISYAVGPTWDSKELWFTFDGTSLDAEYSLGGTIISMYYSGGQVNVHEFCSNYLSAAMNADQSHCYTEYRVEVQEVNGFTLNPVGGVVYSNPSTAGYNLGQIPSSPAYLQVPLSSLAMNTLYRLRLIVSDGTSTDIKDRYFRRKSCEVGPPRRRGAETVEYPGIEGNEFESNIYPNPTTGDLQIAITTEDIDSEVSIEIYNAVGQLVNSVSSFDRILNISIADQPDGVYLIKTTVGELTEMSRIVKTK